jgi:hypothetical protein
VTSCLLQRLICLSAMVFLASVSRAQYTPVDSMRFTKWNPGLASAKGIPDRSNVYATIQASTYGNGATDASAAIQTAIDNCPAGKVVMLSAGTFTVNNLLLVNKNITLRGAGSGVTLLQKTNGAVAGKDGGAADQQPLVIIGPSRWPGPDDATSQNLTADADKGAYSVTMANAAGFSAGQFVLLDELSGASWQPDRLGQGQIWASPDYRVVWKAHKPTLQYVDDFDASDPNDRGPLGWFCRYDRPTNEIKEVAGVSGGVITFTTPLHINYRISHTSQLTRYTAAGNGGNGGVHVAYAGIEGFSVKGGSDGAIRFQCAAYCWAKDIEVTVWTGEGFAVNNSFKCEIRDSYIHDAAYCTPGGGAYAISFADASSEILVENCISVRANKVMVARCSGAGSVYGYNYTDQGLINYAPGWIEIGLNASHMAGPHHVLFEGNYGFNWDSDFTHGNSIFMTVFRNHLRGTRSLFHNQIDDSLIDDAAQAGNGPKRCIGAMAYSYWMTFVGNVLGAKGQMSGWAYDRSAPDGWSAAGIWLLGWEHELFDSTVVTTAVRDGNWDWVQSRQSWHNTTASTLQNSLYLTAKPAFFGNCTWPWVDPSTGTVYTLPARARFDNAAPCGASVIPVMSGSANERTFDIQLQQTSHKLVVDYSMTAASRVRLEIFSILGRKIKTLVDGGHAAGRHSCAWNTGAAGPGAYLCRLTLNNETMVRKFVLR